MEGNMNTGSFDASAIPPGIIMALPVQPEGGGRSGPCLHRRQVPGHPIAKAQSQPGTTVLSNGSDPKNFVTEDFLIKAGEDIGEKLRSYFQDRNHFPSGDHARMGIILSATGTISSPTIARAGSALLYEGGPDHSWISLALSPAKSALLPLMHMGIIMPVMMVALVAMLQGYGKANSLFPPLHLLMSLSFLLFIGLAHKLNRLPHP